MTTAAILSEQARPTASTSRNEPTVSPVGLAAATNSYDAYLLRFQPRLDIVFAIQKALLLLLLYQHNQQSSIGWSRCCETMTIHISNDIIIFLKIRIIIIDHFPMSKYGVEMTQQQQQQQQPCRVLDSYVGGRTTATVVCRTPSTTNSLFSKRYAQAFLFLSFLACNLISCFFFATRLTLNITAAAAARSRLGYSKQNEVEKYEWRHILSCDIESTLQIQLNGCTLLDT